jgi:predicted metal-dependent phosphotriesterase family hydrolase
MGESNFQRNIEHMERELKFGIDTKSEDDYKNLTAMNNNNVVRCSFLGPVTISEDFTRKEENELKAYAAVQGVTKAPLLLEAPSLEMLPHLLDFIQNSGGLIGKTVIAHADLLVHQFSKNSQTQNVMTFLQEQVLRKGAIICCDQYSVSCGAYFDFDQAYPTLSSVIELISVLSKATPPYLNQVVLGCGIFMKLQYRKYGGAGYPIIMKELIPRLKARGGLSQEQLDIILTHNPRRLLQWWRPPPIPEKPKTYLPCSICKKWFEPIMGEYFTKYTFVYCGTKCLRKHRKLGFKANEETKNR